ncbi:VOC family protein [Kitasatospora herbaricolor]|uniref:VOC family protein n=1 Tax=Kitasatospora herbaricolor TaxID=68217 RepID=A0ABZ1WII8_9ACTN|nr:VOC family protein [Kitasatospora herbaricolor]
MITTDFVPGSPCWLDLGAPDVKATAGFYSAVFGWEFESYGEEAQGYGAFKLGGRTVGAIGRLTEEGARSAWMVYFRVADADATTRAVTEAGGAVRAEPFDIPDGGRIAQLTDPQGGQFAIWQPGGTGPALETVDATGSLSWIELYTTDSKAAQAFYGGVFGWTYQDQPLPGGDEGVYTLITPAGLPPERMHGGLMELPPQFLQATGGKAYWHPVFGTADCDASVAKVGGNGGSVQMGPENAEGVGRLAVCLDPNGADFVLLNPSEPPAQG